MSIASLHPLCSVLWEMEAFKGNHGDSKSPAALSSKGDFGRLEGLGLSRVLAVPLCAYWTSISPTTNTVSPWRLHYPLLISLTLSTHKLLILLLKLPICFMTETD